MVNFVYFLKLLLMSLFQRNRLWILQCSVQTGCSPGKPHFRFSCWHHQGHSHSHGIVCACRGRPGWAPVTWHQGECSYVTPAWNSSARINPGRIRKGIQEVLGKECKMLGSCIHSQLSYFANVKQDSNPCFESVFDYYYTSQFPVVYK